MVAGDTVLTIGKQLSSNLVVAYGLVFGLQAIGMLLAVWFLSRVNIHEFQTTSRKAIATVLEGELD